MKMHLLTRKIAMFFFAAGFFYSPISMAAPTDIEAGILSISGETGRLVRKASLYATQPGVRLMNKDLVDSGDSDLHIENIFGGRLALAASTTIYLEHNKHTLTINLINGWIKFEPSAPTSSKPENLTINTSLLSFDIEQNSGVIHATTKKTEIFLENGLQVSLKLKSKDLRNKRVILNRNNYMRIEMGLLPNSIDLPDASFIASMPPAFFDPLPKLNTPRNHIAPKKIRDVDFDDISVLLYSPLKPNNRVLANRFSSRLANPAFRREVVKNFGGDLDWEREIYRFERNKSYPR